MRYLVLTGGICIYKHWWYTVHSGKAIRCDKCGEYAHMDYDDKFKEIEAKENCKVPDEEESL